MDKEESDYLALEDINSISRTHSIKQSGCGGPCSIVIVLALVTWICGEYMESYVDTWRGMWVHREIHGS